MCPGQVTGVFFVLVCVLIVGSFGCRYCVFFLLCQDCVLGGILMYACVILCVDCGLFCVCVYCKFFFLLGRDSLLAGFLVYCCVTLCVHCGFFMCVFSVAGLSLLSGWCPRWDSGIVLC